MAQPKIHPPMTTGYVNEALQVLNGLERKRRFEPRISDDNREAIFDNKYSTLMTERWMVEEMVNNLIARAQRHIANAYSWGIVTREGK